MMKLFIDEKEYCRAAIISAGVARLDPVGFLSRAAGCSLNVQLSKTLQLAGSNCRSGQGAPRFELRQQKLRLAVTPVLCVPGSFVLPVMLDEVLANES